MIQFNFVFDKLDANGPVANLVNNQENWQQHPFVVTPRLITYCLMFNFPIKFFDTQSFPESSWYPVAFGTYKFDIDYFSLIPESTKNLIRNNNLRVLFLYHEGDNPQKITQDLRLKCAQNNLPQTWKFVSANTAAEICFDDHELFYLYANRRQQALPAHDKKRPFDFTALNRVHKWWRATVLVDLLQQGLLSNSLWSYNGIGNDDNFDENPLQLSTIDNLEESIIEFVNFVPYTCDELNSEQQNQHSHLVNQHFTQSYINLVFETFFDVDQSGGSFLTEKTFKPIKHAQPFIIIGAAGSLQRLRELGYRTFDSVIDPSYDQILDNTARWHKIRSLIQSLYHSDLHKIYLACRDDIIHNQKHLLENKYNRLESLYKTLHEQS